MAEGDEDLPRDARICEVNVEIKWGVEDYEPRVIHPFFCTLEGRNVLGRFRSWNPRICMEDELTRVPTNRTTTRFENKVGYLDAVPPESPIKNRVFERFFMDVVAGDTLVKQRAAARLNDLVGSTDVVPGEPVLVLPRRFRQTRAWLELNKHWRDNTKVKGFVIDKVRGGYSVAVGGYVAFLRYRPLLNKRLWSDHFTIESINPKTKSINVC